MSEGGLAAQVQSLFQQEEARVSVKDQWEPFKQELRKYVSEMKDLKRMHPEQAMAWLSSVSARVLEMIMLTLDSESRAATKLRIDRLIPLREELRYQFQVASRRHSIEDFEFKVAGGQAT